MPPLTHALVLTAGLGTRLDPLTRVRAKPAIPVAGEPLVCRILAWLAARGVTDAVLNLHHRPESIAAVVGDGEDIGLRVRYSWEQPAVLGSAGGPRLAAPIVGAATFLVVNGDTLADVDLAALAEAHERTGALVTLALVPNAEPDHYGGVRLDGDGAVTGFAPRGRAAGTYHFVGVQVVSGRVFDPLAPGVPASSIGGLYDALLLSQPGAIRGFVCDASFHDIGTVADYRRTSLALAAGDDTRLRGRRTTVDSTAALPGTILWDDVTVGAGARLAGCIVTDGVRVPGGAVHRDSILIGDDGRVAVFPLESHHG